MLTPSNAINGRGDIKYSPVRAPAGSGWGDWEVHPQRVKRQVGDTVDLVHNGEWLLLLPEGSEMQYLAFTDAAGGQATAARLAYFRNGGWPTRVVGLDDSETAWVPTTDLDHQAVAAAIAAQ